MNILQKIEDDVDLFLSRLINVKDCNAVCLALGPYRNLTTLTASTLFLHPNCQVLNHAGGRIFGRKQLDFLSNYSAERLDRFIQFASRISTKGKRGNYGGSIVHSHAFDDGHSLKKVFASREGKTLKKSIKCLFWKESLRTSNLIRQKTIDLGEILEKEPRLRFIMPIRNPLDCTVSNLKTGHAQLFEGLGKQPSEREVLEAILSEIFWFAQLQHQHPGRFFHYFEHEISEEMLVNLANFLGLEPIKAWIDNALIAMKTKEGYNHNDSFIAFYQQCAANKFAQHPDFLNNLLVFTSPMRPLTHG